jgi:hypothetical protein
MSPAVADVTGDGKAEGIMGSGGYLMYAWDADGKVAEGWPKFTGGWILGSPAVGDIDGDGYLEVAVTTREGRLFVWNTKGEADQAIGWASIHHDAQNTGNAETELPLHDGPPGGKEPPPEDDCGCASTRAGALWLGLAALALVRRRR